MDINIKDIEKYVKDNNITWSDYENGPHLIDYIDTLPKHLATSEEDMKKWASKIQEACKESKATLLIVDSINGGYKET